MGNRLVIVNAAAAASGCTARAGREVAGAVQRAISFCHCRRHGASMQHAVGTGNAGAAMRLHDSSRPDDNFNVLFFGTIRRSHL